jgi:hypothetical protein
MTHTHSRYLDPNGAPYEGGQLLRTLLLFGRVCRALGMDVTPNTMMDVARALEFIHLGYREDFYHTLRVLMVSRKRDLELFDDAFKAFWQVPTEEWLEFNIASLGQKDRPEKSQVIPPLPPTDDDDIPDSSAPATEPPDYIAVTPTFSQKEALRHKNFAEMSGEEIDQARRLLEKLPMSLGQRTTRRYFPGKGSQIDLRRSMRKNTRFGSELIELAERDRRLKPRPLVLICDISGSMERYTRLLLHFTHTLANSMFQVESFVFGTRLTHITRQIRKRSVDAALTEVGTRVHDWGGGTRIGAALHEFNYRWSRRVLGRGAVALLITDGWDRGEPDLLMREAARLRLSCYRLMWLNPLLGSPEYEPLTRGAQAMLPYVDDFLPVHNLASLDALLRELWKVNWRRPERVAHADLILPRDTWPNG